MSLTTRGVSKLGRVGSKAKTLGSSFFTSSIFWPELSRAKARPLSSRAELTIIFSFPLLLVEATILLLAALTDSRLAAKQTAWDLFYIFLNGPAQAQANSSKWAQPEPWFGAFEPQAESALTFFGPNHRGPEPTSPITILTSN